MLSTHGRVPVLIVEDDPGLRSLYRTTLIAAGYATVAVEDGMGALRHIEETTPAVVVLDLGLPRLGGLDVQREIAARADTRHIPIVLVTGDPGDVNPADFACILRKPIDPDMLVAAVERCLRKAIGHH